MAHPNQSSEANPTLSKPALATLTKRESVDRQLGITSSHIHRARDESELREATELKELASDHCEEPVLLCGDDNPTALVHQQDDEKSSAERGRSPKTGAANLRIWHSVAVFWSRQISLTVPHKSARDNYANERTFLGYLRTSLAFAMIGTVIAQLFRLQHVENPNRQLGFFVLGKPLAALCIAFSVFVALVGAYRFWRQQNAMARGKCHAGGWELSAIGGVAFVTMVSLFVLVMAVDIKKL